MQVRFTQKRLPAGMRYRKSDLRKRMQPNDLWLLCQADTQKKPARI